MALDTNTNRLNFPNMVSRQMSAVNTQAVAETYFNPLIITGKRKILEKKEAKRAEMSTSFNSIIASVHNKLKTTQQVYSKVRKLEEEPKYGEEPKYAEIELVNIKALPKRIDNVKNDTTDVAKIDTKVKQIPSQQPSKTVSIPQIKANRANKQLQYMRRNVPRNVDYNDPSYQKRIVEVREQKKILEDMLMQHQRLQHDRQSIAMEIQSMREHLSDIRQKLDVSFKRLTTKPIVYNEGMLKTKTFVRPQQWRGSFTRKPPLAAPAKLPTPRSILKVTNAKAGITTTKSINQKVKSTSNSPVRNGPRQKSSTQNNKDVAK